MIVYEVLTWECPVGDKGERIRIFLTDEGYRQAGYITRSRGRKENDQLGSQHKYSLSRPHHKTILSYSSVGDQYHLNDLSIPICLKAAGLESKNSKILVCFFRGGKRSSNADHLKKPIHCFSDNKWKSRVDYIQAPSRR